MTEQMFVFAPGEKFATLTADGKARVYVVTAEGALSLFPEEER